MIKTIQMVIYIVFTILFLVKVLADQEFAALMSAYPTVKFICVIMWAVLGISFLFIFLDFNMISNYKKDYSNLSEAVSTDTLSGLANRYGCDAIIEKYLDKPLPGNIGCVMFDLSSIFEVNKQYGHIEGNKMIRDFSTILKITSAGVCFVGRNGGNKFMALFEDCSEEKIAAYLDRIEKKVEDHNNQPGHHTIQYKCGKAFDEGASVKTITELIALSNRRIYKKQDDQH